MVVIVIIVIMTMIVTMYNTTYTDNDSNKYLSYEYTEL